MQRKISEQMKQKVESTTRRRRRKDFEGNVEQTVSTGSTLLDLEISGGRVRGGGLPGGIFVEIFGPASSGKTVLLCEIAGAVRRAGGQVMFNDPEARLNEQFAGMFGLDIGEAGIVYEKPDKVTELFAAVRKWEPEGVGVIHGIFADSLAALSTTMEMENDEGDKMGGRRAKEFSEGLRVTCRDLPKKNYLMVASNQIRENMGVSFGEKYKSPGGKAIEFYASLRLKMLNTSKIYQTERVKGKEVKKVIGVSTDIQVYKSSVWKPYGQAPLTILFDYGIDDIRDQLQYLKRFTGATTYCVGGATLDRSLEGAIRAVEQDGLEAKLRNEVIDLWEEIEAKFKSERKPKMR